MSQPLYSDNDIKINRKTINYSKLINTMFPQKKLTQKGMIFSAGSRENYYIESIVPGTYVNKDNDELLVIVRRLKNEPSHVEGLYQAYMAVFDNSTGNMISSVKAFTADLGNYWLLNSKGLSYIFFAGSTTHLGWTDYVGGLWKAGADWTLRWPKETEYWKDKAIVFEDSVVNYSIFNIFKRKFLPGNSEAIYPHLYTWNYLYTLVWDMDTANFRTIQTADINHVNFPLY